MSVLSVLSLLSLMILGACSTPSTHPHEHPEQTPAHSHTTAEGHGHPHGNDHAHEAPHGGEVKVVEGIHLEARLLPEGILIWPTDAEGKGLPTADYIGQAVVETTEGIQTIPLKPMGDHLHGTATLPHGQPATAIVTLPIQGQPRSITFEVEAVGLSIHDHTPLHGGEVAMWGNYHVEYVSTQGEHQFFFSDEKRQKLTQPLTGTLNINGQESPLIYEPERALLRSQTAPTPVPSPIHLKATIGEQVLELFWTPPAP